MTEDGDNIRLSSAKAKEFIKAKNNTDFGRDIFARYHSRMRDEAEFADYDYYEDNIYDEPEYWRMPRPNAVANEHEIRH